MKQRVSKSASGITITSMWQVLLDGEVYEFDSVEEAKEFALDSYGYEVQQDIFRITDREGDEVKSAGIIYDYDEANSIVEKLAASHVQEVFTVLDEGGNIIDEDIKDINEAQRVKQEWDTTGEEQLT